MECRAPDAAMRARAVDLTPQVIAFLFVQHCLRQNGAHPTISRAEFTSLSSDQIAAFVRERMKALSLLLPDETEPALERRWQAFGHNVRALHAYEPKPYSGKITLFLGEEILPDHPRP